MHVRPQELPDVVTADELALAAGVAVERVDDLIARGELRVVDGCFVAWNDAVQAGRRLRTEPPRLVVDEPGLFEGSVSNRRTRAMPAAVSSAAHACAALAAVVLASAGLAPSTVPVEAMANEPMRLVYLTLPGPGGGGGGGGLRQSARPPRAQRDGVHAVSSPVPARRPPPSEPTPEQAPDETSAVETPPAIVAPVAERAADDADREGVLASPSAAPDVRGAGDGGGIGSGAGTGIGEGTGPGLGPGQGGGTGGGPFRPGAGIQPPRLVREVMASYPDEARRLGIRGDVLLEIVVRRDGSVGDVTVLQGLGHGLDQRAVEAVRRWRFSPATRLGSPVDVIVEVAVEFRLH